ncbi:hypothetical protein ASPZODRAFT_127761 [Penicilliopsis zonata CBS 506.65]|uniref:Dynactin subunit 4 n=1 Tax=Penicilliopsis zonata CBS 506.65 TaxID=1073090 RepID=A0A1L9SWY8_9EURO|nr:hypothetical protein ASPZODRAFT_127761 [Penicilliopsis zonata CBS 506.65]OJJ51647.1 hypothetical protein ASPZODRAFT_127761 [Penicilliopsis zonata CBS 506.65]
MSRPFPYTYISCPCVERPVSDPSRKKETSPRKGSSQPAPEINDNDDEEEEKDFDPRSPRANFSLYPPEQLLYCEDCHQIKCPRCITEEIVCWYCPSCLFETPSSMVRSEGNRCARNCFSCPICTAPLAVSTLENVSGSGSQQGPWVLSCGYCMWTTLDIGIKFDKPTNIRNQLSKMTESSRGRQMSRAYGDLKSPLSPLATAYSTVDGPEVPPDDGKPPADEDPAVLGPDARFAALKAFYRNQLSETSASPNDPLGTDFGAGFSSPGALNRIMSLYTSSTLSGLYGGNSKKSKPKPLMMREAQTASEGLKLAASDAEDTIIQRMASDDCGWEGLASSEQRVFQFPEARFVEDLLPLPTLLRTKRSKRCKSCKHILVKPEFKPQSTRFRIRLIALSYIPLTTIRPLAVSPSSGVTSSTTLLAAPTPDLNALQPLQPIQILLTLKNHMFDPVRVTLGTPSVTPGAVATKVTILCPQFDIGANSDVWDEALQASNPADQRSSRSGLTGGYEKVAEAGKVWDKGRNWTTVVLEVVPGLLERKTGTLNTKEKKDEEDAKDARHARDATSDGGWSDSDENETTPPPGHGLGLETQSSPAPAQPDEDVLEIPVFVRMEWDSENQMEQPVAKGKPEMVKRELAYWMVLGVGRIEY